jgi:hypothetical protein
MFKPGVRVRWSDDYVEGIHTDYARAQLYKERGIVKSVDTGNRTANVLWMHRTEATLKTVQFVDIKLY